jgi:hypothetical protein
VRLRSQINSASFLCLFVFIMASSLALSSSHSSNLLEILRKANAHHSRVAANIRASIRPTHHARKRATALKLTISIQKALKLDPRQISTIPPPVVDRVISPPSIDLRSAVVGRERGLAHTLLKSTLPSQATLFSPHSCVPLGVQNTSRWSISPSEADSDFAQELPEDIAVDYDRDMLLCSPTESGESIRFTVELPPQLYSFPPRYSSNRLDLPPLRQLSSVSDISSLGFLGSSSASTSSSHGPRTPQNADGTEKHTIRIKRKSSEMDDDMLEKRRKYGQNGWTISHRRIVQKTIPLRSGRF